MVTHVHTPSPAPINSHLPNIYACAECGDSYYRMPADPSCDDYAHRAIWYVSRLTSRLGNDALADVMGDAELSTHSIAMVHARIANNLEHSQKAGQAYMRRGRELMAKREEEVNG